MERADWLYYAGHDRPWLWDKVSGWISSIWDGICDFFGIASPSKEMGWVGKMMVEGLAGSIESNGNEAVKAVTDMAGEIDGAMKTLADDMMPTDISKALVDGSTTFSTGSEVSSMIITKSISRFARNTADCLKYSRQLRDLGIAVQFEKEAINTLEGSGELLFTILSSLAQDESRSISENCQWGIRSLFKQGVLHINANRFYGYDKDEKGHLIINKEQGKIVRWVFESYMLVCAMNPCKCGWYGDPSGRCTCSQASVDQYLSRISGPMLDRIDLIVEVPALRFDELRRKGTAEPSVDIKRRVDAARALQQARFTGEKTQCNALMQ